jgi:hypothetical protein
MSMIKFTNASMGRKGDPIYINSEWIVSVFEDHTEGGSLATVVFGGPGGTPWFVEESLSEAIKLIDGAK